MAPFRLAIVNAHTDLLYCCMCTSKKEKDCTKEIIQRVSKGGKMVRTFASDQCCLDSNPSEAAPRHILLEFVFGFHPCPERFFSDTSVFSCPQKRTISNSVRFGIADEKPQSTFANTKLIYLFIYDDLFINFFKFILLLPLLLLPFF